MKRKTTILILLAFLMAAHARMPRKRTEQASAETQAPANTPPLATSSDSASYALGLMFATDIINNMNGFPAPIDKAKLLDGFAAVMRGDSVTWAVEDAAAFANGYFTKAQQEKALKQQAEQAKWLEDNARRPEVKTRPSGLQYEVIKEGSGEHPVAASTVKVHYEGKLTDGTIFDSSFQRGEPIEFQLDRVIKGWTEGLQLMSQGAEYILYIPYQLGYGEHGAGQQIPPYATLIFRVQLLEIANPHPNN